ncbi:MAG TPA: hypothetical protein ENH85_01955 [Candidatus Scalindua sp.]|nr:hypothetical protein [Candidatus Scalindua sp.]
MNCKTTNKDKKLENSAELFAIHSIDWLECGSPSFLDCEKEQHKLNKLCIGKTIKQITYNEKGDDYLVIYFTNGESITLSTLGGIEIET